MFVFAVVSHIARPPFELDKNGEPVSFDIDLMNEAAKRVNLDQKRANRCPWSPFPLIPSRAPAICLTYPLNLVVNVG